MTLKTRHHPTIITADSFMSNCDLSAWKILFFDVSAQRWMLKTMYVFIFLLHRATFGLHSILFKLVMGKRLEKMRQIFDSFIPRDRFNRIAIPFRKTSFLFINRPISIYRFAELITPSLGRLFIYVLAEGKRKNFFREKRVASGVSPIWQSNVNLA